MVEMQKAATQGPVPQKPPAVLILAAWVVVGLPAGWGVYNTLLNSMKLFRPPIAAHASSNAQK